MKRVLIVDGPEAGNWVDVPDHYLSWKIPQLDPGTWISVEESHDIEIQHTTYELLEIPLTIFGKGGKVYVGFSEHPTKSGESIIKALFQRDVAKELLK